MGLSEDILWKEFNDLKVAVVDVTKDTILHGIGRTDDLVRYKKYKDTTIESSIFVRELIYKPEYMVYYVPNQKSTLEKLYNAFLNPRFALSLGRDDELIILYKVEIVNLIPLEAGEYGETIVPFNPAIEGFNIDINNQKYFEPYNLATLPSTFISKNGMRTPSGLQTYAFLKNLKIYIKKDGGFTDGKYNFFLL
ncbi:hypothetical protein MNV_250005 [Candidatus Methanoperedens nitroreducens]|uniref:Uncharacterized protein n=2 Tax=Candidatus Methanoperedens nitratireducens TaxID=1392998 RepID=A0A284VPP5_9EURY|nr:hypothetical protein MNV_250005 [Candidatus Methanoperedens nitroreducens]